MFASHCLSGRALAVESASGKAVWRLTQMQISAWRETPPLLPGRRSENSAPETERR